MDVNPDFRDLLKHFNRSHVKYLLIGAYAVIHYTEPRFTKDFDVWIESTPRNAHRVWRALRRFGAPLHRVTINDFCNPRLVYQIGVEPNRIDIMMGIPGVRFVTAWKHRRKTLYGDQSVCIIHRTDLIRAKRAAGRAQDQLDLQRLVRLG